MFAVIRQFCHRLTDIIHRLMCALFLKAIENFRFPATSQLFQGAHVQITVVEIGFQLRHVLKQETAVLTDAVTADRRFARRNPLLQELNSRQLGVTVVLSAGFHAFHQPAAGMGAYVPVVHQR
ncbi:hypothetical protein D3C86_1928140 [compost metagenome]